MQTFKITVKAMETPNLASWAARWREIARNSESRGNELVVFEVPKDWLLYDLPGLTPINFLVAPEFLSPID